MIWKASYQNGDRRSTRRFAWLPVRCGLRTRIWLEFYEISQWWDGARWRTSHVSHRG